MLNFCCVQYKNICFHFPISTEERPKTLALKQPLDFIKVLSLPKDELIKSLAKQVTGLPLA